MSANSKNREMITYVIYMQTTCNTVSTLENMLSINVALTSVILLGLLSRGNIPKLNIMSMHRLIGKLLLYFSRYRVKYPHKNIHVFGLHTYLIIISKCSLNISTLDPGFLYTHRTITLLFSFTQFYGNTFHNIINYHQHFFCILKCLSLVSYVRIWIHLHLSCLVGF